MEHVWHSLRFMWQKRHIDYYHELYKLLTVICRDLSSTASQHPSPGSNAACWNQYSSECKHHLSSLLVGASISVEEFTMHMAQMAQTGLWKFQYRETTDRKDVVIAKISGKKGWALNKKEKTIRKTAVHEDGVYLVGIQERQQGRPTAIIWMGSSDNALKEQYPLYSACGKEAYEAHLDSQKQPRDSQYYINGYWNGKLCDTSQKRQWAKTKIASPILTSFFKLNCIT